MKKKMKGKSILALFTAVMVLSMGVTAFAGMSNFKETVTYPGYSDVKSTAWYYDDVVRSTKLGLFNGYPNGTFLPNENITLAEAIKVAAVIRATYDGEIFPTVENQGTWYKNFISYAKEKNIITDGDFTNYNQAAKRNEMAYIFSRALPTSEYEVINDVTKLPDVNTSTLYQDNILVLFKAGVLSGDDSDKTFRPNDNIKRAEAAAIFDRVVNKSERIKFIKDKLTSSGGSGSTTPTPPPPPALRTIATLESLTYSYTDSGGNTHIDAVTGFTPTTTQYAITIYDKDFDATRIDMNPVVTAGSGATVAQNDGVDLIADSGTTVVVVTAEDTTITNQYEVLFSIDRRTINIANLSYGKYTAGGAFMDLDIEVDGTDSSGAATTESLTYGPYYVSINGATLTEGVDYDVVDINLGTIKVYTSALNSLTADRYDLEVGVDVGGLLMTGSQYLYAIPATSQINYVSDTGDAVVSLYSIDLDTYIQGAIINDGDSISAGDTGLIIYTDTSMSGKTVTRIVITQTLGTTMEVYDSDELQWMIDDFTNDGYLVWGQYGDVIIEVYAE